MTGAGNPYGALNGGDPYQGLDAEQRAKLDAAVVRMRTENDVRGAGGDLGPLEIDRSATTYTPPPPPPAQPGETADEQVDRMLAERAATEVEDFSAFWAEQGGGKKLTGVGNPKRDLQLPKGMPLRFEVEAERLKDAQDMASVKYLFDLLFGTGTWDDLVDRGLDTAQIPVLFLWGTLNLGGRPTTLAEAVVQHEQMVADKAAGKALTPPPGVPPAPTGGATSAAPGR